MGLYVTLVHCLSGELSLDDDIRFLETLLSVAEFVLDVAGDIAFYTGVIAFEESVVCEMGA
jgi:hypothetical protein